MDKELITRLVRAVDGMPRYDIFFRDEATMMRFAFMIAEECVRVCIETQAEKFLAPEHGITYGYVPVCADFVDAIRAKFTA